MEKPIVKGAVDGNIFAVMAAAKAVLPKEQAEEMIQRVRNACSYDEALIIILDYVDFDLS